MSDVQVGFEESFDGASTGIDTDRHGAEDSGDGDSVSWFTDIDKFIIETDRDGVRSLTVGDDVYYQFGNFGEGEPGVSWRRTICLSSNSLLLWMSSIISRL